MGGTSPLSGIIGATDDAARPGEPSVTIDDAERHELKELLAAGVASTRERLGTLERELASIIEGADTANIDDEHDPEGATIAYERALVIAMVDSARAELEELERASAMVRLPEYGTCSACGEPIGSERLRARPAATMCVECAARGGS
jgi:RNA polymerase-binding transcription factor DksA